MSTKKNYKGTIGILTGGGDVPGLNPAISTITIRAEREGFKVIGIRKGWEGLLELRNDRSIEEQGEYCQILNSDNVMKQGRTGGTFLHTSRTNPGKVKKTQVPIHLQDKYHDEMNDMTGVALQNIDYLELDYIIPIGGDDTLSYGHRIHEEGIKVVAIPKTMDNDVPGTDYCIGFSTCITRTIEMAHSLRTCAGSHERFLVLEVFGRYAGYTALLPTMAGAANRCVIPEYKFDINHLTELLIDDRRKNSSNYSVVLVSEGASFEGGDRVFSNQEADAYGHKKLGGIGDIVADQLKRISPRFNNGKQIDVINQRLGYAVRSGDPDATDSIVPMAFGNLCLNLILEGKTGRMVSLRNGRYDSVPIDTVVSYKKLVDVGNFYNTERYRPIYKNFEGKPLLIMTSD